MHFVHVVSGFSNTKILYGNHVMMNDNNIADKVFAAFDSCRFSWDFFFLFSAAFCCCFSRAVSTVLRGMIFAFNGSRLLNSYDGCGVFNANGSFSPFFKVLNSSTLLLAPPVLDMIILDKFASSGYILMEGSFKSRSALSTPQVLGPLPRASLLLPSIGSLINIV